MKFLFKLGVSIFYTFFFAIVVAVVVGILVQCDHIETVTKFSFHSENSTANSDIRVYCKECDKKLKTIFFRGNSPDDSYLDVINIYRDADEVAGGQYYKMTATVTLEDYDFQKTTLSCKVEADDVAVYFSVEFKDEYEAPVSELKKGDEVTFCGEFYAEGCGFKNCELILQ